MARGVQSTWTPEDVEPLLARGWSDAQICAQLGVTNPKNLRKILRKTYGKGIRTTHRVRRLVDAPGAAE